MAGEFTVIKCDQQTADEWSTFKHRSEEMEEDVLLSGKITLQAEEIATVKSLAQECLWHVGGRIRWITLWSGVKGRGLKKKRSESTGGRGWQVTKGL